MRRQLCQTKIGRLALLDPPGLFQYKNTITLTPYGKHDESVFHGDGQGISHIFKYTNRFTRSCIGRPSRFYSHRDLTGLFSRQPVPYVHVATNLSGGQRHTKHVITGCAWPIGPPTWPHIYIILAFVPQPCLSGLIWHRRARFHLRTTAGFTR